MRAHALIVCLFTLLVLVLLPHSLAFAAPVLVLAEASRVLRAVLPVCYCNFAPGALDL